MAFYSLFVGINKFKDNKISDLCGAVRDATAMWALFSDSISYHQGLRLIDESATKEEILQGAEGVFNQATDKDTALFYFAGHGTRNHQLVPFDCDTENVDETTIDMEDLIGLVASSKAKVNIIILDCCFSGGATARVLSEIPKSRSIKNSLTELQGKGRVIIAAANENQPAYEINTHGVLTKTLLDIFCSNNDGVTIGELSDEIAGRINSIVNMYGWDQTPVIFNLVEGVFRFPVLKRGTIFKEYFPETSGIKVKEDITELKAFNIHNELLKEWKKKYPKGLNQLQLEAVNDNRILDGESLFVVAPTSSGKTFIGELAAAKAISDGKKAVFLLPYRALTNEKYEDFKLLYGEKLNLRVLRCTGDFTDDTSTFVKGKFDICLLTYEMFLSISLGNPSLISKLGLIVIDEAQFITDSTRGINLELLITNLISFRERGYNPQLVLLSAVIGDVNHFNEWLECGLLKTEKRPIPLIEGVVDYSGTFQYRDLNGETKFKSIVPSNQIFQRKSKRSNQDLIIPLVKTLIDKDEQVIIFRNNKGSTKGCANYLAKELNLPPASKTIGKLPSLGLSRTSDSLRRALNGGTALHNSDLQREERVIIEEAFRERSSEIKVLAATTTVAAGVNTPASTVIIVESFFYGKTNTEFTVAEYKNMAGRAGRLGITAEGKSILIAENEVQRARLFKKYVLGNPEKIHSTFDTEDLSTWTIRLLSQVNTSLNKEDVIRLISNTYGGFLINRNNPNWGESISQEIDHVIDQMLKYELLEIINSKLELTLLGKVSGQSSLSFNSITLLIDLVKERSNVSAENLIALIQVVPEVGGYTPLFKKGNKESQWQSLVSSYYGAEITKQLQKRTNDHWAYYARCKRAAILMDWIQGVDLKSIESKYTITPYSGTINSGEINRFADSTRLFLRSAYKIIDLLLLGEGPDEDAIDNLLVRLEYGIPEESIPLLEMPVSLTRGEILEITNLGAHSVNDLRKLNKGEIERILGVEKSQIITNSFFN